MVSSHFADLLKLHRISAGLSQEELAELSQVSVKAVSALERGARRAPYRKTVALLAEALGLETAERSQLESSAARARFRTNAREATRDSRHNLPSQVTSLVGREDEVSEVSSLLARHRLVTLTGSGGVGKTRLSIAVAHGERPRFPDGVWFIDLAPLEEGRLVATKIASTLGFVLDENDPIGSLALMLRTRKLLLIADNCEQVVEAAASVTATLLRDCPNVKVVATSRQRLALKGEVTFRLPSLGLPPSDIALTSANAARFSAIRLFVERAALADHRFVLDDEKAPMVGELCHKLDGIPLAIELCAAQLHRLGLPGLRRSLGGTLISLSSDFKDVPMRQQTLMATIDWSYRLLGERERAVFRRISVFADSCSAEAACEVSSGDIVDAATVRDVLSSLVDKSLLHVEHDDETGPRYYLLESSKDFGLRAMQRLGESGRVVTAYGRWAASFADAMRRSSLTTTRSSWNIRASREFDNLYSALQRMLEPEGDAAVAGLILGGSRSFWNVVGRRAESFRLADTILDRLDGDRYPDIAASLQLAKSFYVFGSDRLALVERATALYTRSRNTLELALCYKQLAHSYSELGRLRKASQALGWASTFMALAGIDDSRRALLVCELRADILQRQGLIAQASTIYEMGVRLARNDGDPVIEESCIASLGELEFSAGHYAKALLIFKQLVVTNHEAFRMHLYEHLAATYIALNKLTAATESARIVLGANDAIPLTKLIALERLAHVAALSAEPIRAARLRGFVNDEFGRTAFLRDSFDQRCSEALLSTLCEQLDLEAIERHARDGAALSFDRAVAEALGEIRS